MGRTRNGIGHGFAAEVRNEVRTDLWGRVGLTVGEGRSKIEAKLISRMGLSLGLQSRLHFLLGLGSILMLMPWIECGLTWL